MEADCLMKFYLIDDDRNVLNILKRIFADRNLGEVCGTSSNPLDALEDLSFVKPDIIIVDLLMPEVDGITFVKRAKKFLPDSSFIMLSQVSSKDIIADAYDAGINFYIQKPINSIEVESVVRNVTDSLTAKRTLQKVQNIFISQTPAASNSCNFEEPYISKLRKILNELGISGEKGSADIICLIRYLTEEEKDIRELTLSELCAALHKNSKSTEQRIRRAASVGLTNLASIGLEDYSNDIFTTYSNTLYNFEQVRKEMDHIRGKNPTHGNVKIKSFLHALMLKCQEP